MRRKSLILLFLLVSLICMLAFAAVTHSDDGSTPRMVYVNFAVQSYPGSPPQIIYGAYFDKDLMHLKLQRGNTLETADGREYFIWGGKTAVTSREGDRCVGEEDPRWTDCSGVPTDFVIMVERMDY